MGDTAEYTPPPSSARIMELEAAPTEVNSGNPETKDTGEDSIHNQLSNSIEVNTLSQEDVELRKSSGESKSARNSFTTKPDENIEEKPLFNILQKLGESQQRAMENFYQSAVEAPCRSWTRCQEMSDLSYVVSSHLNAADAIVKN